MAESPLTRSKDDPAAFGLFYRERAVAVTRYFARRIVDAEAALDLTAETFAQAYSGRHRFRGTTDDEARAWLYTITQRQLAGYLRRGYAHRKACVRLGLERPAPDAEEDRSGRLVARLRLTTDRHDPELRPHVAAWGDFRYCPWRGCTPWQQ